MPTRFSGSAALMRTVSPLARGAPDAPQPVDRLGQCVLLADEARDEAASAHQSSRLAKAERAEHVAPRDREALAGRDLAKHDAVARQELLRDAVGDLVGQARLGLLSLERGTTGPARRRGLSASCGATCARAS